MRGGVAFAVVVGAVIAIWWRGPDWGAVWDAFDSVTWRWVIVAVVINFFSVVARSVAWKLTVGPGAPGAPPALLTRLLGVLRGAPGKRRAARAGR